jgi:tRNA 2-thiouridine synthesizing protein A
MYLNNNCKKENDKESDDVLDARGLFCPEPVMLLHKRVREMAVGQQIKVLATDPSTQRDIPKFCHFLGHQLLESWTEAPGDSVESVEEFLYVYLIGKSESSVS